MYFLVYYNKLKISQNGRNLTGSNHLKELLCKMFFMFFVIYIVKLQVHVNDTKLRKMNVNTHM